MSERDSRSWNCSSSGLHRVRSSRWQLDCMAFDSTARLRLIALGASITRQPDIHSSSPASVSTAGNQCPSRSRAKRRGTRAFRTPHESLNERAYGKDVRVVTQPASAGFLKDVRVETRVEMPDRVYQACTEVVTCGDDRGGFSSTACSVFRTPGGLFMKC